VAWVDVDVDARPSAEIRERDRSGDPGGVKRLELDDATGRWGSWPQGDHDRCAGDDRSDSKDEDQQPAGRGVPDRSVGGGRHERTS
jgi:hypothetical protein